MEHWRFIGKKTDARNHISMQYRLTSCVPFTLATLVAYAVSNISIVVLASYVIVAIKKVRSISLRKNEYRNFISLTNCPFRYYLKDY